MVKTNDAAGQTLQTRIAPLKESIRNIPDFPTPGILFRDITPLLSNPELYRSAIDLMSEPYTKNKVDYIVGIESRGFILASAMAYTLNSGLVLIRKKGKLPHKTHSVTYALEYGQDSLEIHQDAFAKDASILIVDDVLATGGTAKAAIELVEKTGGKVAGIAFLIELAALKGREKISSYPISSLIQF